MTQEERMLELAKLAKETTEIHERSSLQLATSKFLMGEVNKLSALIDDESLPFNEKEKLYEQVVALEKKLLYERKELEKDDGKIDDIRKRLKELS
jgi:hypothetical protein